MSFIVHEKIALFACVFTVILVNDCFLVTLSQTISTVTGSQVQLHCRYTASSNKEIILWTKKSNPQLPLSENIKIYISVPTELRQRLNITGDHDSGEYNLMISGIKKSDEGKYECSVYGNPSKVQEQTLVVIDGPTGLNIKNKQENKLLGTEGRDLTITCTANGGDPAPNMKLQIGRLTGVYRANNQHTIEKTVTEVSRSFDGATVTCEAGYEGVAYTPMTDTAVIELYLKPLTPSFSMEPIVTENTKSLVLTCTSTGSRPAPTERTWLIGDSTVDITFNSTPLSSSNQSDRTFTATSKLTYKVNKIYNQQNITCGFKNTASENFVLISKRMNVKYAPCVTVQNKDFTLTQTTREIPCVVDGNPASVSIWQHKSKYGELIRNLDGNNTLILPEQAEEIRYQDTGEYVCSARNGIRDEEGNLTQRGSGYIVSQAPPRLLNGSSQVKLGQYGKNVDIEVSVYSEPKYRTPILLKDGRPLSQSTKYTMADVSDVITDTFYGAKVQVDGFRLTLTIKNLVEGDFVNYTLKLSNGVGETVEHLVVLLSASPPETPNNFTIIDATDSTITLQWKPAFDGGHEQTFFVEYRTAGSKSWKTVTVSKESTTLQNESFSYELPGLEDSTSYEVRMFAENKFNKSQPTAPQMISTKASAESSGQGAVIGAVVGVSTAIIIILVIVAVMIVRRRRDGNGTKKNPRSDSESDEGDGLKVNILYKSVDTGSSKPPEATTSEYAEVQKPHDVYAEVGKPKQQKDTKEKKQKGKKLPGKKKKPKAVNNNFATEEYANQLEYGNVNNPTGGYKNADGLQYADITFGNPPKTKPGKAGKPVIHGLDDRTIYSDVDHTKKAPPLPQEGAYELTDISKQS